MNDVATIQVQMYLAQLVGQSPWLFVMLVGGLVCLSRLSTRPREGWLVGGAIGLTLFANIGLPQIISLIVNLVPGLLNPVGTTGPSIWGFRILFGLPISIIQATAWGLILYAAFGEGSGPRSKYLIEDEQPKNESD